MRAVEGPLATRPLQPAGDARVRGPGGAPAVRLGGPADLDPRRSSRTVTVADLISGKLPKHVVKLTEDPDTWISQ